MADWFFPKLGGGEEQGLNESGIEIFKQKDSLARETCQNIGDVWNQQCGAPAIATFELVDLPANEFPGRDQLKEIFSACKDYVLAGLPDGTGNEQQFFKNALEVLDGDSIPLLRIGDENTTGLLGTDDDRRKPFFRLLKGQGSSSLQGGGGGTYGIGQRAPFARSALRTVLYSTRTPEGVAFIAKSILATFLHPRYGYKTQSKGWWCEVLDNGEDWKTIRTEGAIPPRFLRETIGTDLWIAGFQSDNWEQSVRHSVLRHFFAAIENNQLVVQLMAGGEVLHRIDSSNLGEELIKAANEERSLLPSADYKTGLGSTLYFHKAIKNPHNGSPFVRNIPSLGEVKLYLYRDTRNEDMPDRWATMRKPRIIVEHFGSTLLNRFAGVLICDTDKGNQYLSQLEDPEHKRWHEDETRQWTTAQKKEARKVLAEIKQFVRETLKLVRGAGMDEQQDIPFLGRYLPAEAEAENESEAGIPEGPTSSTTKKETGQRRTRPRGETVRGEARKTSPPIVVTIDDGNTAGPDADRGEGPTDDPGPAPDEGTRGGSDIAPSGGDPARGLSPKTVRFRAFRCDGGYKVVLESETQAEGSVKLQAVGETGQFPVVITAALDEATNEQLAVKSSSIEKIVLKPGVKRVLKVQIETESELVLALGA